MFWSSFLYIVGCIIRIEVTSLMKLVLCKMRMDALRKEDQETTDGNDFRRCCRFQNGAEDVIENVVEYLWHDESETCTGLSMFPVCHSQGLPHKGGARDMVPSTEAVCHSIQYVTRQDDCIKRNVLSGHFHIFAEWPRVLLD